MQSRELSKPSPADGIPARIHQTPNVKLVPPWECLPLCPSSSNPCSPILLHPQCSGPHSLVAATVSHEDNVQESLCRAVSCCLFCDPGFLSLLSTAMSRPCHAESADGREAEWSMLGRGQTPESSAGISGFYSPLREKNPTGTTKVSVWWVTRSALGFQVLPRNTFYSTTTQDRGQDHGMTASPR